jgi:mannose-6-phosphate isomerase-like protein (cupin superfamily)
MKNQQTILVVIAIIAGTAALFITQGRAVAGNSARTDTGDGSMSAAAASADGYVIQRDKDVAKDEPGPHNGGGPSTGYIFFEKVPDLKFSFRKRVLHRGAAIGYHLQATDEVYYIIGGSGKMTMNGNDFPVKPGDAILTRGGSSHGLVQTGDGDLTIIITFQK